MIWKDSEQSMTADFYGGSKEFCFPTVILK
jgi:hypothetical protein